MKKFIFLFAIFISPAAAQDAGQAVSSGMSMHGVFGRYGMNRDSSGTSWQPDFAPAMGAMTMSDGWMLMTEVRATGTIDNQSGPRGASDDFAIGMAMAMASRDLANGDTLGLRAMLSIDPFMGRRGYPLLFQTGETANGVTPLIDRQHPHNLFMELAGSYSHPLSASDSIFVYAGDPGEPALGPSAYMHRLSGMDNPETPISHHWLDSTHITFGVVTAGWVHDGWKLEASQFTGREPDQHRFSFNTARLDSTSARLSYNPDPNWSLQVSGGFVHSPEQLTPAINEQRLTASATWYMLMDDEAPLAVTAAIGNKRLSDGVSETALLLEAELVPGGKVRHASKIALGVVHDWPVGDHLKLGLGGVYDFDFAPSSSVAPYGGDPHGMMLFVRAVAD